MGSGFGICVCSLYRNPYNCFLLYLSVSLLEKCPQRTLFIRMTRAATIKALIFNIVITNYVPRSTCVEGFGTPRSREAARACPSV